MSDKNYKKVDDNFGDQNYKFNDMGTDASFRYSRLSDLPQISILTKESEGTLTRNEMDTGMRKRVIILRYNGVIREVVPEEFEEYKDKLAEGLYQPITFFWALSDQLGLTREEYNQQQVEKVAKMVDGSLETFIRQWFSAELSDGKTNSAQLKIDKDAYVSPIRKVKIIQTRNNRKEKDAPSRG